MKKLLLSAIITSAMAVIVAPAFAEDTGTPAPTEVTVNGGTVNFEGSVVNAACGVDSSSANQTVRLGQFRVAEFTKKGDETGRIPFSIKLNNCDITVSTLAAITFNGTASDGDASAFALQGSGAATNVALKITDSSSKNVIPGQPSTTQKLIEGENQLNYNASLVSTDDTVKAGSANVTTNFMVTYS
ncbi:MULTISPECIES: fimbrial protein [Proteus]|uniref:Fimbrial protein n=1 Tax=Proteus penneri TaxID=102862 RepID=A0A0G4QDI9_9GAMM|nr:MULTISPECIES: fimbrial protein [Proteus]EEG87348.1 fimbrial protein [Proteus penneri ATCC 35198]KLU18245.1 fimbrial protein [Proteus mirabilis]MBJ2118987.1 fimbrial protein [Proteus penneri]MCO8051730.1 fimbrial protein [Proteus penneri]MCX2589287.1 fimbrial protein [Proteus penneri]